MTRKNMLHCFCYAIARSDMTIIRLMLAIGAISWAVMLFWSGDVFSRDAGTYSVMARMANEYVWGLLFLAQGVAAIRTMLGYARSMLLLLVDAWLGCILWTSATLALFAARLHEMAAPVGMSAELVFMVASWIYLVRHWAEQGDSDAGCK